jgi:hypothetical protein
LVFVICWFNFFVDWRSQRIGVDMTQEALKQMYQLLLTEPHAPTVCLQLEAIAREALAQLEQEPVAWMNDSTPSGIFARHIEGAKNFGCTIPLYATPPQRTEPLIGCVNHDCDKCREKNT